MPTQNNESQTSGSVSNFGLVESDLTSKKYSSAMRRLVLMSNEYSQNIYFLRLLARTQKALSDFSGLIKSMQVIANLSGSHQDQLDLMEAFYNEGRLNEALDVGISLQEQSLSPMNRVSLNQFMVKLYIELSDFEGVAEIAQIFRDDDFMLWAMGLVCLHNGDQNQALTYFRESVTVNSMNENAWLSLAMLHEEMGDKDLARANVQKALDINAKNASALRLMTKLRGSSMTEEIKLMEQIRYYLSDYAFDEEVNLCYVKLLTENKMFNLAKIEVDKLILNNPKKSELHQLKKNLAEQATLC